MLKLKKMLGRKFNRIYNKTLKWLPVAFQFWQRGRREMQVLNYPPVLTDCRHWQRGCHTVHDRPLISLRSPCGSWPENQWRSTGWTWNWEGAACRHWSRPGHQIEDWPQVIVTDWPPLSADQSVAVSPKQGGYNLVSCYLHSCLYNYVRGKGNIQLHSCII